MAKAKTAKAVKAAKVPETVYISEADQYLFAQGTHYDIYKKLGAHQSVEDGKKGMSFAVWAPHAASVSVIGTFNSGRWSGRALQISDYHAGRQKAVQGRPVCKPGGGTSGNCFCYDRYYQF